jgi:hypothetical protein
LPGSGELFFGSDRYDNSRGAQQGFRFQNNVTTGEKKAKEGPSSPAAARIDGQQKRRLR